MSVGRINSGDSGISCESSAQRLWRARAPFLSKCYMHPMTADGIGAPRGGWGWAVIWSLLFSWNPGFMVNLWFLQLPRVVFQDLSTILRDPRIPNCYSSSLGAHCCQCFQQSRDPRCENQTMPLRWDSAAAAHSMGFYLLHTPSPHSILKNRRRVEKGNAFISSHLSDLFLSATSSNWFLAMPLLLSLTALCTVLHSSQHNLHKLYLCNYFLFFFPN